jgi:hypothetical protein
VSKYADDIHCIMVRDSSDDQVYGESALFRIKGHILTRHTAVDSSYEAYVPGEDGWSFENADSVMWPQAWWSRFNYTDSLDPVTGQKYPSLFSDPTSINAQPQDFPDWPLFVDAFTVTQCYVSTPSGWYYRPSAVAKWWSIKGEWSGVCNGFALTSVWGFDDSSSFRSTFPRVDPYTRLFDFSLTDGLRKLVNQASLYWYGKQSVDFVKTQASKRPVQTLADIRAMLAAENRNDAILYISGPQDAHALTPYKIVRDPAPGSNHYRIYVYEMGHPADTQRYVVVDTFINNWWYQLGELMYGSDDRFLLNPLSDYMNPPILTAKAPPLPRPRSSDISNQASASLLYHSSSCTTVITDASGDSAGYADSASFNTISGAVKLISPTGSPAASIGYSLPPGPYTVKLGNYSSPEAQVALFSDSLILGYARLGADSSQTDIVEIDSGLRVRNAEAASKAFSVLAITLVESQEVMYHISGLDLATGDSVGLMAISDDGACLVTAGADQSYRLQIVDVSSGGKHIFAANDISIRHQSTHCWHLDWVQYGDSLIQVQVDLDNDGSIDSTGFIGNSIVTDVGDADADQPLPYRFELSQNYPNPFNPVTTIEYSLPRLGHVSIEIYNVLGQKVRTLVDREESAGSYTITWNGTSSAGSPVATGVYLYRFQAGDHVDTKKMLLLK